LAGKCLPLALTTISMGKDVAEYVGSQKGMESELRFISYFYLLPLLFLSSEFLKNGFFKIQQSFPPKGLVATLI